MIFVKYLSLIEMIHCSMDEKVNTVNTFPVITNYSLDNDADFDALAFLAFNDFMISILCGIILNDTGNIDSVKESLTLNFFKDLFLPKSIDGDKNVYNVLNKYRDNLKKIKFEYDAYNTFLATFDNNKQNLFLNLCTWYYKFMEENKNEIMGYKSLIYFYIFCAYLPLLYENECDLSNVSNLIALHSVDHLEKLEENDFIANYTTDSGHSCYRYGCLIFPVFNSKVSKKDRVLNMQNTFKRIYNYTEIQCNSANDNKKIEKILMIKLRVYIEEPMYVESNYNIKKSLEFCQISMECFWLNAGFYSFWTFNKYFDAYTYCNPIDFISDNKFSNKNSYEDHYRNALLDPFFCQSHEPLVCMFSNYDKDMLISNHVNQTNVYLLAILNYTTLKLASGTFTVDVVQKNLNNFFKRKTEVEEVFVENKILQNQQADDERLKVDNKTEQKDVHMSLNCENNEDIEEKNDFNIIFLDLCLFIYENLIMSCKNMGIKYDVNVFSILSFVDSVLTILEKNNLYEEEIIRNFLTNLIDHKLKIDLFKHNDVINIDQNQDEHNSICNKTALKPDDNPKTLEDGEVINYIDTKEKEMLLSKRGTSNTIIKCKNDIIIISILITGGLKAILTSLASYKTTSEYVQYLAETCFRFDAKKYDIPNSNSLYNSSVKICSSTCSSNNFQTKIEETITLNSDFNLKPVIFYYNYYICKICNDKMIFNDDHPVHAKCCTFQDILTFDEKFVEESDKQTKLNHLYVFNIVIVYEYKYNMVNNVKDSFEYNRCLLKEYNGIIKMLNEKKACYPKRLVIKHENENLTQDSKTFYNENVSKYYKL